MGAKIVDWMIAKGWSDELMINAIMATPFAVGFWLGWALCHAGIL